MKFETGLSMKPGEVKGRVEPQHQNVGEVRIPKPGNPKDSRSDFEKPFSEERLAEAKLLLNRMLPEN